MCGKVASSIWIAYTPSWHTIGYCHQRFWLIVCYSEIRRIASCRQTSNESINKNHLLWLPQAYISMRLQTKLGASCCTSWFGSAPLALGTAQVVVPSVSFSPAHFLRTYERKEGPSPSPPVGVMLTSPVACLFCDVFSVFAPCRQAGSIPAKMIIAVGVNLTIIWTNCYLKL